FPSAGVWAVHRVTAFAVVIAMTVGLGLPRAHADRGPGIVEARNGVVVSVSEPASKAGLEILRQDGNAVDATVATAFALAVTFPEAGNIGGGGFMLVYPGRGVEPVVIDYRETAPAAVDRDSFANLQSRLGPQGGGVPRTVRGLALAHQRFGKLPWQQVVLPAVRLTEEGFVVNEHLAPALNDIVARSEPFAEFRRVFGKPGGSKWQAGDRLVQKDLARTLRLIAEK